MATKKKAAKKRVAKKSTKKASRKKKRQQRRANRRAKIQLVTNYVEDFREANPNGTKEQCFSAVGAQLRKDFKGNPFIDILITILKMLLDIYF